MPMQPEAKVGHKEGSSFEALVAPALPKVRAIVRRMVGNVADTEDIVQDTLIKAYEGFEAFRGESRFETWLISIATRSAIDHLRRRRRWRTEAQIAYANLSAADESISGEVMSAFSAPDASFEVRQHIAYCFTCVGRSLPPDELAALVLRDVADMSNREAATALGISESVLRHRLSAARSAMTDKFEGLCALVNKRGICHQCRGLSEVAKSANLHPGPLPQISDLASRMAVVRGARDIPISDIHALFFRHVESIEENGRGSTVPETSCGAPD